MRLVDWRLARRCSGSMFGTDRCQAEVFFRRVSPSKESLQSAVGSLWIQPFTGGCSPGWAADIHLPFSLYRLLLLP
jgi:hypothetical protein